MSPNRSTLTQCPLLAAGGATVVQQRVVRLPATRVWSDRGRGGFDSDPSLNVWSRSRHYCHWHRIEAGRSLCRHMATRIQLQREGVPSARLDT